MIQAFIENPILLLFVVAGIGFWIGSIKFKGTSLGVAAVLFVGLAFGGLSADFHIPETIIFLGLTIFVYAIGLSSGPSFFANFKQRGFTDILFIIVMLTVSASIVVACHFIFNFQPAATGGIFAGSTTNTAALAGLLDVINTTISSKESMEQMGQLAVVGYSLTYPMGIFGAMVAILLMIRIFKIDFKKEEQELKKLYPVKKNIITKIIRITNPEVLDISIRDLKRKYHWEVVFGRRDRGEEVELTHWDSKFKEGDLVVAVGDAEDLTNVASVLGEICEEDLPNRRGSEYVTKRIFVSNPQIAGQQLATLNLGEKFAAIVTRIRRGDMDLLANANTSLELGDQVQFISRRKDISKLSAFFGDSFEALGKINLLSFGLGMAMGLLLGMLTFQLPGGVTFKLGFAGGPIIVALILGTLRRTGPIVWTLPYGANLTLRQIGLTLMLAGIGINSGHTFVNTIAQGSGGLILLVGAIISFLTAVITLFAGYKLLKIPFSILLGIVATQPAILDFAMEKSDNKLPMVGFTLMMPVAMIIKILYVQILFTFLN